MKLKLLGTETSGGVPELVCFCVLCHNDDERVNSLRCLLSVMTEDSNESVDFGPAMRQQFHQQPFRRHDSVLPTHNQPQHPRDIETLPPRRT